MVNALIPPTIDCMRITGPLDYQPMNLRTRQATPQFSPPPPPLPPPYRRQQPPRRWKPQRPREPESQRRPLPFRRKISIRIQLWPSLIPSPLIDLFTSTIHSLSYLGTYWSNEWLRSIVCNVSIDCSMIMRITNVQIVGSLYSTIE